MELNPITITHKVKEVIYEFIPDSQLFRKKPKDMTLKELQKATRHEKFDALVERLRRSS